MKKNIISVLSLVLLLTISACGNSEGKSPRNPDVEHTDNERSEQTMFPDEYKIDIEYHHMTEEEIESIKTILTVDLTETESEISEAEVTWDFSEIHGSEEGFIVSAQDLYNDEGWGWFLCGKSGTYHFQAIGAKEDIYSPSADHNLVWKVYLMEKPFIDTPRFIPQAGYEAVVTGGGSVEVGEGTYIVIYCSQNSYEYGLSSSYEGDPEAFYQCTMN